MVYNIAWDEASPPGASTNADTIDTEFQDLKESVRERMNDILDPLTPWEDDLADPKLIDVSLFPPPTDIPISILTGTPQVAKVWVTPGPILPSGVAVTIGWNMEFFDTNDFHDNAVNNSRLTVPDAAYYRIYASMQINAGGVAGTLNSNLKRNGASFRRDVQSWSHPNQNKNFFFNEIVLTAANDFFEVDCRQDTGTTWNFNGFNNFAFFGLERLSGTT